MLQHMDKQHADYEVLCDTEAVLKNLGTLINQPGTKIQCELKWSQQMYDQQGLSVESSLLEELLQIVEGLALYFSECDGRYLIRQDCVVEIVIISSFFVIGVLMITQNPCSIAKILEDP